MSGQASKRDLALSYSIDWETGKVGADLSLTATGDLATVSGIDKLKNWIIKWMITPRGSWTLEPDYGNPYLGHITPQNAVQSIHDIVKEAQDYFAKLQNVTTNEQRPPVDQLDRFEEIAYSFGPGEVKPENSSEAKYITLSCVIVAKSNDKTDLNLPFQFNKSAS